MEISQDYQQDMQTYLSGVNMTIWKSHRHVIFIHDLPTYSAYNGGVRVMTQGNLLPKFTQSKPLGIRPYIPIAHRTVNILGGLIIACRQFE
jgi:hypothetical protein